MGKRKSEDRKPLPFFIHFPFLPFPLFAISPFAPKRLLVT